MEGLDMCVHASVCVIQSTTNVTFSRRDPLLFLSVLHFCRLSLSLTVTTQQYTLRSHTMHSRASETLRHLPRIRSI